MCRAVCTLFSIELISFNSVCCCEYRRVGAHARVLESSMMSVLQTLAGADEAELQGLFFVLKNLKFKF